MKKVTDDINRAVEKCVNAITIAELALRTGVKVETLKRFVESRSKHKKKDILEKIYPEIRSYILLKDADENEIKPVRIGAPVKMGHYLDDLVSDEKILLDTFGALDNNRRDFYYKGLGALVTFDKIVDLQIKELSKEENGILSIFRALDSEIKEEKLQIIIDEATELMKTRRIGL